MPLYYAIAVRLSFSYFVLAHSSNDDSSGNGGGVIPPVPPCLQKRVPLSAHSKLIEARAKERLNYIMYIIHYYEFRVKTDPA